MQLVECRVVPVFHCSMILAYVLSHIISTLLLIKTCHKFTLYIHGSFPDGVLLNQSIPNFNFGSDSPYQIVYQVWDCI